MKGQVLSQSHLNIMLSEFSNIDSDSVMLQISGKPVRQANVTVPAKPSWLFDRPHLAGGFVKEPAPSSKSANQKKSRGIPVGKLPEAYQEHVIIEQLLYCLLVSFVLM